MDDADDGEPSAEPASPEARDVLRFFLDSFTDPQLARAAPAARAPSMVTLTPLYKEDAAFGAATLSARVDGGAPSALRFLISMMPTEWAAMLQRCGLTLPGQDYEALLQTLHDEVAAAGSAREDDGARPPSSRRRNDCFAKSRSGRAGRRRPCCARRAAWRRTPTRRACWRGWRVCPRRT